MSSEGTFFRSLLSAKDDCASAAALVVLAASAAFPGAKRSMLLPTLERFASRKGKKKLKILQWAEGAFITALHSATDLSIT